MTETQTESPRPLTIRCSQKMSVETEAGQMTLSCTKRFATTAELAQHVMKSCEFRYNSSPKHFVTAASNIIEKVGYDHHLLNQIMNKRLQLGDSQMVQRTAEDTSIRSAHVFRLGDYPRPFIIPVMPRHRSRRSSITLEPVDVNLVLGAFNKQYSVRKGAHLVRMLRDRGYVVEPYVHKRISCLFMEIESMTMSVSIFGRLVSGGQDSEGCPTTCFSEFGMREFLVKYRCRHEARFEKATAVVFGSDGDNGTTKSTVYLATPDYKNSSVILACIARAKENKQTTQAELALSNIDVLFEFARQNGLQMRYTGDLPSLSQALGLKGHTSNVPCFSCNVRRRAVKDPAEGRFRLANMDEFYAPAEPR